MQHETAVEGQIEGLDGVIAVFQANATVQAAFIAQLLANVTTEVGLLNATIAANSASGEEVCGHVQVRNDADLRAMMPMLIRCTAIDGIEIAGMVSNVTLVNEAFANVRIAEYVEISSNGQWVGSSLGNMFSAIEVAARIRISGTFSTLGDAFPALRSVSGYIQITGANDLATMGSAFVNLVSVGTSESNGGGPDSGLRIHSNRVLSSAGTAFRSLRSVENGLKFDTNGHNAEDFCTSVDSILCPAAAPAQWEQSGSAFDASGSSCCTSYCASSGC